MTIRVTALMLLAVLLNGCVGVDLSGIFSPPLKEQRLLKKGGWSDGKLVVIDISGEIGYEGSMLTAASTNPGQIMEIIRKIDDDPDVRGLILRINSPGGEVAATDTIFHELELLKRRRNLPVVTSIIGLGCSGAYYLAVLGDTIYAQPSSIVGSIGVLARMPQLGGLAGKIGYDETIIKSGEMKDMGNPLKPLPPEVKDVIQGLVDNHYQDFIDVVLANRKPITNRDTLITVADGRVYSAKDALENNLIDNIGYLSTAVDDLRRRAGLENYEVITYRYGESPDAALYSKSALLPTQLINLKSLGIHRTPGFFFIWQP